MVKLSTTHGEIVIELDRERAPITCQNVEQYVKDGHYDGTVFHRVINGFMIQGGGMDRDLNRKPTRDPIQNEAKNGLKNAQYTVAMARTGQPHSATAQFFINLIDNTFLDYPGHDGWGYCVFGRVVDGIDTVDRIKALPTARKGGHKNVPTEEVVILSATLS